MIHASRSFSHIVKVVKHDDHVLITDGVYRFFRHPSYVGFFYWALATQLLLGNVASTVAFALVLGRFFHDRIIGEPLVPYTRGNLAHWGAGVRARLQC
jgi:protein-S-isoprenylcysteine O-methyltransferase